MSDHSVSDLHDRLSRGEPLSETERQVLQTWYAQQDAEEDKRINTITQGADATKQLQQQIAQTALQLQAVTHQIATTIATNEAIRAEIAALHARLAQQAPGRAA